mgnify:CR=1 FL=1
MKILKYAVRAGALCAALFTTAMASAQSVQLKVLVWNILSFEEQDQSGAQAGFPVDKYVDLVKAQNPDIVCFNEFETGTSRMGKEKMAEIAALMEMYPFYIMSYPKDEGFYGNVILSKYPIVATGSKLFSYKHYQGDGNYQWNQGEYLKQYGTDQRSIGYADVLVPTSESAGKIVRIACTHYDHMGDPILVPQRQMQESIEYLKLGAPEYPTIMMGDLNVGSGNILNPLREVGDQIGYEFVDHIWTFPKGAWSGSETFESKDCGNLSDHDPVMATVTLK